MEIREYKIGELKPYEKNPRRNDGAVDAVAESIRQFGFKQPIVVDKNMVIIAGHTRYKAAQKLGLDKVPCIMADDLTEEQIKAYRLVDNKTAELAGWDFDLLKGELKGLDLDAFDLSWGVDDVAYDFSDFDRQNEELEGEETVMVTISIPRKYENQILEWLANGERKTAVGFGMGVLKRCGLL